MWNTSGLPLFLLLPCWSQRPGQGRRAAPAWCGLARPAAEEEAGKRLHPWLKIHPLLRLSSSTSFLLFTAVYVRNRRDNLPQTWEVFFFYGESLSDQTEKQPRSNKTSFCWGEINARFKQISRRNVPKTSVWESVKFRSLLSSLHTGFQAPRTAAATKLPSKPTSFNT